MLKAIIIIVVVIAILVGGMLTLRSSRNTGMPSEDVLKRATKRADEQAAKDEAER
jgi:FtsZ-interacting cell division protein ZipA